MGYSYSTETREKPFADGMKRKQQGVYARKGSRGRHKKEKVAHKAELRERLRLQIGEGHAQKKVSSSRVEVENVPLESFEPGTTRMFEKKNLENSKRDLGIS